MLKRWKPLKNLGATLHTHFVEKCGNNGKSTFVSDMKKIPGAPKNRDIRCECSDRPSLTSHFPGERICRCDYDC
ncbi:unnamed protein product [Arabidopsis halleri]